jgi:T5SS/PEP-CTERM-associated repeat protein
MRRNCLIAGFLFWIALGCCPSEAQYSANFQTNIISGVTSNWSGSYYVGYTTFADTLLIHDSGVLNVGGGGAGILGFMAGSSNNVAVVTGSNSVWKSPGGLVIGYNGAGNQLVIADGGAVLSDGSHGFIGFASSSSNNMVTVSGSGSVWSNRDLQVGVNGLANQLVITNGGAVCSSLFGCLGCSVSSINNLILVTGSGSAWYNRGNLYVGGPGNSNQLAVSTDGSVVASNAYIGYDAASVGNQISVSGGNLYVTNAVHNAVLEVRRGQLILSGGLLQADTLVITNSCAQFIHTGGTLIVGKVVLDPNTFRIVSVVPQSNDLLVTWMMGPGQINALQATAGGPDGSYNTNGFSDIFIVTNNAIVGAITNYLDLGAATNVPARYYRARLVP